MISYVNYSEKINYTRFPPTIFAAFQDPKRIYFNSIVTKETEKL